MKIIKKFSKGLYKILIIKKIIAELNNKIIISDSPNTAVCFLSLTENSSDQSLEFGADSTRAQPQTQGSASRDKGNVMSLIYS